MEVLLKVNAFKTGYMETSKNPADPNLYILDTSGEKVLVVSKNL